MAPLGFPASHEQISPGRLLKDVQLEEAVQIIRERHKRQEVSRSGLVEVQQAEALEVLL